MALAVTLALLLGGCLDTVIGEPLGGGGPELRLMDATLGAASVSLGQEVPVRFKLRNVGGAEGTFGVQLLVDGLIEAEQTYTLGPGAVEAGNIAFEPQEEGTYQLEIGSTVHGREGTTSARAGPFDLTVAVPAEVYVTDVTASANQVPVDAPIAITASVTNGGSAEGSKDIRLFVDGKVHASSPVTLAGGASTTVAFEFRTSAPKSYSIGVEHRIGPIVEVFRPSTIIVYDFGVTDANPDAGDVIGVILLLKNEGDREGTVNVEVKVPPPARRLAGPSTGLGGAQPSGDPTGGVKCRETITLGGGGATGGWRVEHPCRFEVDWVGARTLELRVDNQLVDSERVISAGPDLRITGYKGPYSKSDRPSCQDYVWLDNVRILNEGGGSAREVELQALVDGKERNLQYHGRTANSITIPGIAAGDAWQSGEIKVLGVSHHKYCPGETVKHKLVLEADPKYGSGDATGGDAFRH